MSDCLFCMIANKKIKTKIIFEDRKIMAFQDINPQDTRTFFTYS